MALKSLVVHLDQGERTAVRLALAIELAKQHHARLLGVFAQQAKPRQVGVISKWPSAEYAAAAAASKEAFARAAAGIAEAAWVDMNRGGDTEILKQLTDYARYADLAIVGQHDEEAAPLVPPELAEEVVLNAGRPVLVIPCAGEFSELGQRPLIAWNNSRESAHAVADAMALIQGCGEATVLSLETQQSDADESAARLVDYLASHGIEAKAEVLVADDVGVMDMLLSRVSDLGTDLLVMGGHGPQGFPFASRGAGTQHILRHMIVPVLMSN